jgi:hypothetical protein
VPKKTLRVVDPDGELVNRISKVPVYENPVASCIERLPGLDAISILPEVPNATDTDGDVAKFKSPAEKM